MTIKQLTAIIDQAFSLKLISQGYSEIASAKLKKIRNSVEKNRNFLEDLSSVHQLVKQIAMEKHILPAKNNKTIRLLITSNYHFYGDVNTKLIKFYLDSTKDAPSDQIIIGKTALEWFTATKYALPYDSLVLERDYPTSKELEAIVEKIKMYTQVLIFYSRIKSVMVQIPTFTDITQTAYLKTLDSPNPDNKKKEKTYIFEPEMSKILDFFESQVTNLLLQQTFFESELSRTASRLISMDRAQTNADKYINEQKILLGRAKQSVANNNLLQTYAALRSLQKEEGMY